MRIIVLLNKVKEGGKGKRGAERKTNVKGEEGGERGTDWNKVKMRR